MKKLYLCEHCGNLAGKLIDSGIDMVCCGDTMTELVPRDTGEGNEKHIPVIDIDGNTIKVTVGSTFHPMTEEHHISFIILETSEGFQRKILEHTASPEAVFELAKGDKVKAAYAYCNIHGFWMAANK